MVNISSLKINCSTDLINQWHEDKSHIKRNFLIVAGTLCALGVALLIGAVATGAIIIPVLGVSAAAIGGAAALAATGAAALLVSSIIGIIALAVHSTKKKVELQTNQVRKASKDNITTSVIGKSFPKAEVIKDSDVLRSDAISIGTFDFGGLKTSENFMVRKNIPVLERSYLSDVKLINAVISTQELPEDFVHALQHYSCFDKCDFSSENMTVPCIPIPTNEGLRKITRKYDEKYHINISVWAIRDFGRHLETIVKEENFPRGAIVVANDGGSLHVTPIILNKHQGRLEVLALDVLGQSQDPLFQQILDECEGRNIVTFCSEEKRQADRLSCRTNAVVTLRNALIDLKQRKGFSFESVFLSSRKKRSEIQDNPFEIYSVSNLPYTWRYGDQIYPKNSPAADEGVIASDIGSNKREKVEHPREIGSFRQKERKQQVFEHKIKADLKEFLYRNKLNCLPEEWNSGSLKVEIDGEKVVFTIRSIETHNVYMVHKALKYREYCESNRNQLNFNDIL